MQLRVKPVLIVVDAWHVFAQPNCLLHVTTDVQTSRAEIETIFGELLDKMGTIALFLEPAFIEKEQDLARLKGAVCDADALLVYQSGGMPNESLQGLWDLKIPIIAFSGHCTPMMGLYVLPADEREFHPNVTFALDYREIEEQLRLVGVSKRLRHTKMILPGTHQRETYFWQHIPDLVVARRKLGIEFLTVSCEEFLEDANGADSKEAEALAEGWINTAKEMTEPSPTDVTEAAKIYLAIHRLFEEKGTQAVSVGCLELMYVHG